MRNSERTIDAVAIFQGRIQCAVVFLVAGEAHVVGSEAAVEGSRAAVHAFPVDLDGSMLWAFGLTSTDLLQQTLLAEKIFFLCLLLFLVCHLLLTVNQTSEVRLLAAMALVNRASEVRKFLRSSVKVASLF